MSRSVAKDPEDLSIQTIVPASRTEWEHVCVLDQNATFFHTPYWAELFSASDPRSSCTAYKIVFSDGAAAILPFVVKKYFGPLLSIHHSMPGHCFGGWVSSSVLSPMHGSLLIRSLHRKKDLVWRENPFDPLVGSCLIPLAVEDFTQTIDCSRGFDEVASRFDYAHEKAVRKAVSCGVIIMQAETGHEWREYYSLYQKTQKRWETNGRWRHRGYSESFFEALFNLPKQFRKLWVARMNGTIIAGIVCFYWNRHAVAWHGAGDEAFFKCRPNNMLYEHAIRAASDEHYRWFDCNPSGGLAGVVSFKEHLGAQRKRARYVNKRSPVRRIAEFVKGILQ